MTDGELVTMVELATGEEVSFQDYFVRLRHDVPVRAIRFAGTAAPTRAVRTALETAGAIVIAPSNPLVSIGPVRALPGVDEVLAARREHVVAVSPIVGGAALKGPADRMLAELGHEPSVVGVARLYAPVAATLVIDPVDAELAAAVEAVGVRAVVVPSVMSTPEVAAELARSTLSAVRFALDACQRRASRPSASVVQGDQARWIRARTGDTEKRTTSSGVGRDVRGRSTFRGDERPQIAQRRLHAGAHVDDQPAAPMAGTHQGVDDVIDVDEVARLAPIAGDPRRRAAGGRGHHRRHDAGVGSLAGAVHGRRGQRREFDPPPLPVRGQQVDDGLGHHAAHAARLQ